MEDLNSPALLLKALKIQRLRSGIRGGKAQMCSTLSDLTTSPQKVDERPKENIDIARAKVPSKRTGFLPM
jgi:hypothetical protein